jgi:hypothetical protein
MQSRRTINNRPTIDNPAKEHDSHRYVMLAAIGSAPQDTIPASLRSAIVKTRPIACDDLPALRDAIAKAQAECKANGNAVGYNNCLRTLAALS